MFENIEINTLQPCQDIFSELRYLKNDQKIFAHTKAEAPSEEWQTLSNHLHETARKAEGMTRESYRVYFRLSGLLHDFGKYQAAFQRYLIEGGRCGSVPHAAWGAGYAKKMGFNEISMVIDDRHKGLPDRAQWLDDCAPFLDNELAEFDQVVHCFIKDTGLAVEDHPTIDRQINKNERELLIRYIFSAMTDADWLDTEKFCSPGIHYQRINMELDCKILLSKLEKEMNKKNREGRLNELRCREREFAVSRAGLPAGFFSMNLPTGMGKTLASISWGLHHASCHNMKRIIIVLPFVNIIDQTAQILKGIFGDEWVLEHHSGNTENLDTSENTAEIHYRNRVASENWDYPIIVTTTVQFFKSPFGNRPSRCRKVHNIAVAVVIFDEVQSLPKELVLPTIRMLDNVHKIMGSSFLFCAATQPAFEARDGFNRINCKRRLLKIQGNCFGKQEGSHTYFIAGWSKLI